MPYSYLPTYDFGNRAIDVNHYVVIKLMDSEQSNLERISTTSANAERDSGAIEIGIDNREAETIAIPEDLFSSDLDYFV